MQWFKRETKDLYKIIFENLNGKVVELVQITRGHFKGVQFYYGFVKFVVPHDGGEPRLKYEYFTLFNPKNRDVRSEEFQTLVGDILMDMIQSKRLSDHFVDLQQHEEDLPRVADLVDTAHVVPVDEASE